MNSKREQFLHGSLVHLQTENVTLNVEVEIIASTKSVKLSLRQLCRGLREVEQTDAAEQRPIDQMLRVRQATMSPYCEWQLHILSSEKKDNYTI